MKTRPAVTLSLAMIAVFVLTSSPGFALQDSPISLGPKLGVSFADFSGLDLYGAEALLDFKTGFCGGAFVAYAVNDWFTIQPELLYSMKGLKLGILEWSAGFSLDYIEIPLLAMLTIPTKSRFTPNIFFGPTLGFNVRAEFFAEDESVDIKEGVKGFEAGIAFGAGVKIGLGPGELTFDGRYVMGLTDVFDASGVLNEVSDGDVSVDVSNSVISILVGYAF